MSTLLTTLDLRGPLARAGQIGASFLGEAIEGSSLKILRDEIAAGSFDSLPEQIGPYGVREEAELLQIPAEDFSAYPAIAQLRTDLMQLVREHGRNINGLEEWRPNDIAAMRYHPGSLGITPHRDGKRHRYLIAIVTIEGAAAFNLCTDREGTGIDRWPTTPGSLVLMRGPGLNGAEDGRPFHTVSGPTSGARVSLTFRMGDGSRGP
jgi:hypothetical protein